MKIFGIGHNYKKHIEELGSPFPEKPVVFSKPDTALLRNNEAFYIPNFTKDVHHEVEIVIKICKVGKNISPEFAPTYYNEIGLGIDFTARDIQQECKQKGLPWEKAKGFDGSAQISKSFIEKSELTLDNIPFSLEKNGEQVQKGNSKNMLFNFDKIGANFFEIFENCNKMRAFLYSNLRGFLLKFVRIRLKKILNL